MKNIFNKIYIDGNELLFYTYVILILIMIILTVIFVVKEIKRNDIR